MSLCAIIKSSGANLGGFCIFFAATVALWNSGVSYPSKKETVSLSSWLLIILLNNSWLIQSIIWNHMINGMSCRYSIGGTSFWFKLCSSWSLQSSKRSTTEIVDGLLWFDLFLVLGFLPAVFGAPPNAILVIDIPDLDLLHQVTKSDNLPYFSATAIVSSHIFVLAFTQFRSHLKDPPFPGVTQ